MLTQGLGPIIANAFGHGPSSTATPVNNPGLPSSIPEAAENVMDSSSAPVVICGSPIQRVSGDARLVTGQKIHFSGYVTVPGLVVSSDTDSVALDGTTHSLSNSAAAISKAVIVVGGNTAQRAPNSVLVIASQTIAAGVQGSVAGVAVSIGSDNAIIDGMTRLLTPPAASPLALEINGATTTLQPGGVGSADGQVVKIGGQDETLSRASTAGQPSSKEAQPYVLAGKTLIPGYPAITANGVAISLPTIRNSGV